MADGFGLSPVWLVLAFTSGFMAGTLFTVKVVQEARQHEARAHETPDPFDRLVDGGSLRAAAHEQRIRRIK